MKKTILGLSFLSLAVFSCKEAQVEGENGSYLQMDKTNNQGSEDNLFENLLSACHSFNQNVEEFYSAYGLNSNEDNSNINSLNNDKIKDTLVAALDNIFPSDHVFTLNDQSKVDKNHLIEALNLLYNRGNRNLNYLSHIIYSLKRPNHRVECIEDVTKLPNEIKEAMASRNPLNHEDSKGRGSIIQEREAISDLKDTLKAIKSLLNLFMKNESTYLLFNSSRHLKFLRSSGEGADNELYVEKNPSSDAYSYKVALKLKHIDRELATSLRNEIAREIDLTFNKKSNFTKIFDLAARERDYQSTLASKGKSKKSTSSSLSDNQEPYGIPGPSSSTVQNERLKRKNSSPNLDTARVKIENDKNKIDKAILYAKSIRGKYQVITIEGEVFISNDENSTDLTPVEFYEAHKTKIKKMMATIKYAKTRGHEYSIDQEGKISFSLNNNRSTVSLANYYRANKVAIKNMDSKSDRKD